MGFQEVVGYTLLVVFPVFEIFCYLIMRLNNSDIAIRKRNTVMIYICTIAAWLAYINFATGLFGGIRCGSYHIIIILLQPLSMGPQLLRGVTLWGMLEHNKFMLEYGETTHLRRTKVKKIQKSNQDLDAIQEVNSSIDEEALESNDESNVNKQNDTKAKAVMVRKKMKFIVKVAKIVLIGLPTGLILAMLSTSEENYFLETEFIHCFPGPSLVLQIGQGLTVALTVAAIASTIFGRHLCDELGIRREITRNVIILFVTNVVLFFATKYQKHMLHLTLYVIQQMMLSFSMIIMPCFFSSGTEYSLLTYIKNKTKFKMPAYGRTIPNVQASRSSLIVGMKPRESVVDKERTREMTMSLDAGLCILLSSADGIKTFTEHCSREFSVENIRFWSVVNSFHRAVDILRAPTCEDKSEHDESDIRAFAEEIFEKYVKVGSESQINISAAQRKAIEKNMEKSARIERSVFDNAQKEVYALMSRHSYPRFLASKGQEGQAELSKQVKSKRTSLIIPSKS